MAGRYTFDVTSAKIYPGTDYDPVACMIWAIPTGATAHVRKTHRTPHVFPTGMVLLQTTTHAHSSRASTCAESLDTRVGCV